VADEEARRPEVVDELLGRVQRTAQADLVADLGQRVPAGQRGARVHERDAGALEHRQRRAGLRAQRTAEGDKHVGRRRSVLGPDPPAAVHDHAGTGGGREHGRHQRQVRRLEHAVVGAGAGDDRPAR
jgi:hypothetical protein